MIALKRLSADEIDCLRRQRRMARQGRRLRLQGYGRSLCPAYRRQPFGGRRPAARRDAALLQSAGLSAWLSGSYERRDRRERGPRWSRMARSSRRGSSSRAQSAPARVLAARLVRAGARGRNAVARDGRGRTYLLPTASRPESARARGCAIEVTRAAFPGSEPWKRAACPLQRRARRARPGHGRAADRAAVLACPAPARRARGGGLVRRARRGAQRRRSLFAGGSLRHARRPRR